MIILRKTQKKVLVIGAGVSGLTTAICLKEKGFDVTIVAADFAPQVTSVIAGALWEWPPAVCGYHQDQRSLERSKEWCMKSYHRFSELALHSDTGVYMRQAIFYFRHPVSSCLTDLAKMNELKGKVNGFVHTPDLIQENRVNTGTGVKDAYAHLAPMIDTDHYMKWLFFQAMKAGCEIHPMRLHGNLMDQEEALKSQFNVQAIVNCAGLGSIELAGEDMFPLRGALVRVYNDGRSIPKITKAHCVSHKEHDDTQDIIFIVPRGQNMLVLGGLAEPDQWSTEIELGNYRPLREMVERCINFLPDLGKLEIDCNDPLRVGLRPFRRENVRLELQPGTAIIHNYGHGGAGVTFSWGCAIEAASVAHQLLI